MHRIGRCRASCIGDGSWGIVSRMSGKAGGTVAVRRTLATTICRVADPTQVSRPRQLRDPSTVMRFRPAHQSMINRRDDDRASCPAQQRSKQLVPMEPRIHAPATWNGGHESGQNATDGAVVNSRHARESGHPGQPKPHPWLWTIAVCWGDEVGRCEPSVWFAPLVACESLSADPAPQWAEIEMSEAASWIHSCPTIDESLEVTGNRLVVDIRNLDI